MIARDRESQLAFESVQSKWLAYAEKRGSLKHFDTLSSNIYLQYWHAKIDDTLERFYYHTLGTCFIYIHSVFQSKARISLSFS